MKFGRVKTAAARGCVLAHALRLPGGRIAKGRRLTAADLRACADAGVEELTVLRLAANDLGEDAAATRAARAAAGPQLRTAKAAAGRVNLFARRAGLCRVDGEALRRLNAIDPALTIATLPDRQPVGKGQMVATVKAIRFAVRASSVAKWERRGAALHVAPYRRLRAGLIQTTLPTTRQALLAKGVALTERRLRDCEAALAEQQTCAHQIEELAAALAQAAKSRLDLLLVLGASSVCDPHDVVPAAIRACGGEVVQVGMPVDPGNLLVLGRLGRAAVIGMPSCARSPKENGFDWVLRRVCAGEDPTAADFAAMGMGGLLEEAPERPMRRLAQPAAGGGLAAVLLAAGSSKRMGRENKLLLPWRGKPLLLHALDALIAAKEHGLVAKVTVVLGHERAKVARLLRGRAVTAVHNPAYATGMASSLKAGVASLGSDVAGALICLGDMPGIAPDLLKKMAAAFGAEDGKDIVIPSCQGKYGHPKIFGAAHFDEILRLEGDVGAQAVIGRSKENVLLVPAGAEVLFDIDTPAQRGKQNSS